MFTFRPLLALTTNYVLILITTKICESTNNMSDERASKVAKFDCQVDNG